MIRDAFMCYICRQPSNRVKLCNNVPVCPQCFKDIKADAGYDYIIPENCVKSFFFMNWMVKTGRLTEWPH